MGESALMSVIQDQRSHWLSGMANEAICKQPENTTDANWLLLVGE